MSTEPSTDLSTLKNEEHALSLPTFTPETAWQLGTIIRTNLLTHTQPAVINITHANSSQLLFHTVTHPGSAPDNDSWVARKRNTVLRFGHSSWYMKMQYAGREDAFATTYGLGSRAGEFAIHGGGYPIRVKGVDGIVAVVVVSGLKQADDHNAIVEGLTELLKQMGAEVDLEKKKEE